jgi:molecular chaperone GrpE (heat shock protein)
MAHLGLLTGQASDEASTSLVQVNAQLREVLAREGLERIDSVGVEFDPTVHEATAMDDGDTVEEASEAGTAGTAGSDDAGDADTPPPGRPTVTEVWRSGYKIGDRVIRPAMVRVRG